jgi:hypothetical protein
MQLKHWQASDQPQRKSRRTPQAMRRKRRQLQQLRLRLQQSTGKSNFLQQS